MWKKQFDLDLLFISKDSKKSQQNWKLLFIKSMGYKSMVFLIILLIIEQWELFELKNLLEQRKQSKVSKAFEVQNRSILLEA